METSTILAFLSYSLIMSITPGPNNILTLSCVGQYGLRACVWLIMGISGGFFAVMLLCGLFSMTLSRVLPEVTQWLTWLGAGYILWLAWHIATAETGKHNSTARPPSFIAGFLLQFINVKVVLCGLTALSSFVLPHTTEAIPVLLYSMALAIIGAGSNWIWGWAGNLLRGLFQRWGRWLNMALGLSLVYCVVQMFV